MRKINNKINNKGELTTQQLVMLIILIISFVVILFLLWRLNLGEETQKEICHNSVVMVAKGKGFIGELDCKTNYICISGGDECEGFVSTSTIKANTEKEITDALQKEVSDCWWMFGEGKIDYLKTLEKGALGKTNCAICDTIKFDKTIQDKFANLNFNNKLIITSEKYSIITGMKSKVVFGIGSEELFIGPEIVKTDEINSQLGCGEFISKA